jgi:hypothetical protein
MKFKLLLGLALGLSSVLLGCRSTASHSLENRQWGPATNGLRMSLSVSTAGQRGNPEFEIAFWNVGEQDFSLNVGKMLANGRVQLPSQVHLELVDDSGRSRELHYSAKKRYPGAAGRLDDYVVPLRTRSACVLELRLDEFWSPGTEEFDVKLNPGRYKVSARFEGSDADTSNLDMAGMKLMNFWKGKLQSNVVVMVE